MKEVDEMTTEEKREACIQDLKELIVLYKMSEGNYSKVKKYLDKNHYLQLNGEEK